MLGREEQVITSCKIGIATRLLPQEFYVVVVAVVVVVWERRYPRAPPMNPLVWELNTPQALHVT